MAKSVIKISGRRAHPVIARSAAIFGAVGGAEKLLL